MPPTPSAADPRERFSATVDLYRKHRPGYPMAALDWIADVTDVRPPAAVMDLGCGTGISSRLLEQKGYEVVAIDPNEAMLAEARATVSSATSAASSSSSSSLRYRVGECTRTGVADASVDLVLAAQAFHWFPIEETIAECKRVLRGRRAIAAMWNVRAAVPFLDDYESLIRRFSTDYAGLTGVHETIAALAASPSVRDVRRNTLENVQHLDRDGLRGRAWSSSYVMHGVHDQRGFDAELDTLFDRYAHDGFVAFEYSVEVIVAHAR